MAADAADEVVKLGVQLTGANDAAASIAAMEREIAGAADGVRELEAQLKVMQGQKAIDIEQFRAVSGALDEQRAKLASLQASYVALGGKAERALNAAKPPAAASVSMDKLKNATNKLGGAFGPAGASALELYESLTAIGFAAAASLVAFAALLAIVAIFAAGVAKAGAAADAARSELLGLAGALDADAAAAEGLQAAITRVAAVSALGRAKISDYGQELAKAGLRGEQLRIALDAAAVAGSAGGDALAKSFLAQATAAARAGQSVDALAAKIKNQYGGIAARQMLSLTVQGEKLKENFDALFSGANIEPFLRALANMLSIFSQSTETGRLMRDVITKAMSDFYAGASLVLPYVKEGMLGVLIVFLQTYIWIKKAYNALKEFIGPIGDLGGMEVALIAGKIAGAAMLVVIVALAAAVSLLVLPWLILGAAVYGAYKAIVAVVDGIRGVFAGLDLSTVASGMIDGLISGITGSIGRVVKATTDLANSAVGAMKAALDMHSPSRIFREDIAERGIGDALVLGFGDSEEKVDAAASDLVEPSAAKNETMAARGGSGGRPIVYIETLIVQGIEDFRARLAEEMDIAAGSAQAQEA